MNTMSIHDDIARGDRGELRSGGPCHNKKAKGVERAEAKSGRGVRRKERDSEG